MPESVRQLPLGRLGRTESQAGSWKPSKKGEIPDYAQVIFYKHFIGDYQRKTNRLSILEDGVYRRLLDEYYANESPLPLEKDACFRLVRAIKPAERKAVLKILPMYFTKTPDGYIQERADEEIIDFKDKSDKASRSAKKRWGANAHANAHANADAMESCERNASSDASHSQKPKPKPKKAPATKTRNRSRVASADTFSGVQAQLASILQDKKFQKVWSRYPNRKKKLAAGKAWQKLKPDSKLIAAIHAALDWQCEQLEWLKDGGQYVPLLASYLNGRRWEDERCPEDYKTEAELKDDAQKKRDNNVHEARLQEMTEKFHSDLDN